MLSNPRVLITHTDEEELYDLKVILDFLGEEVIVARSLGSPEANSVDDTLFAVVIGGKREEIVASLKQVYAKNAQMPVILFENPSFLEMWQEPWTRVILGHFERPFKYTQVLEMLHRCQVWRENLRSQDNSIRPVELFRSLVGTSQEIQVVREAISHVAPTDVNVLILGESGTGKEVVARNIHYYSHRHDKPFVPVNCGAIPTELLESELFGHEKGAFTGAITTRAGRFEMAKGGTLFLDEIGDMPLSMQVKILRVLQEKTFEHVGSNKPIQANVRIISATHRNLEKTIQEGTFREDLYYRLNVFPIEMPSLKGRTEDIPFLVNDLITRIESENRGSVRLSPNVVKTLCQYSWPGNVRELANLIERLVVMHPHGIVDVSDLPKKFRSTETEIMAKIFQPEPKGGVLKEFDPILPDKGLDLKDHLNSLELKYIKRALEQAHGVVSKAAQFLNLRRTTLTEKMKKYGLIEEEQERC